MLLHSGQLWPYSKSLERLTADKHSSLFRTFTNNFRKSCLQHWTLGGKILSKKIGIDEHASLLHCNINKYATSNFHRFFFTCACSDRWTWTLALIIMRQVFYRHATVTGQIFTQRLKLIILSFFLWVEGVRVPYLCQNWYVMSTLTESY